MISYNHGLKPSIIQVAELKEQLHLCRRTYNAFLEHHFNMLIRTYEKP